MVADAVASDRRRSPWRRALEVLATLGPLLWILWSVDLRGTLRHLATPALAPLLLTIAALGVSVLVGVVRWRLLLKAYGSAPLPPLTVLTRHTMASLYFNLLPGAVGGDLVRAYRVKDAAGSLANSLMVGFVDRLCGLVGLMLLVGAMALLGAGSPNARFAGLAIGTTIVTLLLAVAATVAPWLPARSPWLNRWLSRAPAPLCSLRALRPPSSAAPLLLAAVASLVTQGAVMVALVAVVLAVAPASDVLRMLPVAPWIVLLIFAPLTPLGLGQRELVFVELWAMAGVSRDSALGASVLYLAVGLLYALSGGLVLLFERLSRQRQSP
jgi:uncharacterized membrane protein YbhN (UPF0104 family)